MYVLVKAIFSFYTISILMLHGLLAHDHGGIHTCENTLTAQHISLSLFDRIEFFIHQDLGPGHLEHIVIEDQPKEDLPAGQAVRSPVFVLYDLPLPHFPNSIFEGASYSFMLSTSMFKRGPPLSTV